MSKRIIEAEEVFVGTDIEEALTLLSYRMKLTTGDRIELTDGTKAVVLFNHTDEMEISCITPVVGRKYEYRYSTKRAPYAVIKAPVRGSYVSLDTLLKEEGLTMCHELAEDGEWQKIYELIPKLEKLGVGVSKFVEVLKSKNS